MDRGDVVTGSRADRIAQAGKLVELFDGLDDEEAAQLLYDWEFWRRSDQAMPDLRQAWTVWMIRAGRGYGKTRTGAETIRQLTHSSKTGRLAAVAPSAGAARDVLVEGESGLLAVSPPWDRPKYEPSKRRVTWNNGAKLTLFSGEEPENLRGPEHEIVWLDEPASMDAGADVVTNARLGLRLGKPRLIITGTPKRRQWMKEIEAEPTTVITRGSTYENIRNLAPEFIRVILGKYEGTRLGLQELHAENLDEVEGALWLQDWFDTNRFAEWDAKQPDISLRAGLLTTGREPSKPNSRRWRTIVAVDPPGETAECGIVVGSAPYKARQGIDHAVILADESKTGRPEEWGAAVVAAYNYWGAEAVYVEKNQGGDMCRSTIHAVDSTVPVKKIHAVDSKQARAEPVSALEEKGWIHHVGHFSKLEDQSTSWVPTESRSPDRLDAKVHLIRELLRDVTPQKSKVSTGLHSRRI